MTSKKNSKKIFVEDDGITPRDKKRIMVVLKRDRQVLKEVIFVANKGQAMKATLDIDIYFSSESLYGELGKYSITIEEVTHEREESENVEEDDLWDREEFQG